MKNLPKQYQWLNDVPKPWTIQRALELYGTKEVVGPVHNPTILNWADEVAENTTTGYADWAGDWYNNDEIPWCGLYTAVVALRAAKEPPVKYLSAGEWAKFGTSVPIEEAMLGDIIVYKRKGGHHVHFYIGEDKDYFHGIGGNQSNMVNISRTAKNRCIAVRRPIWKVKQPASVKKYLLEAEGSITTNEQ